MAIEVSVKWSLTAVDWSPPCRPFDADGATTSAQASCDAPQGWSAGAACEALNAAQIPSPSRAANNFVSQGSSGDASWLPELGFTAITNTEAGHAARSALAPLAPSPHRPAGSSDSSAWPAASAAAETAGLAAHAAAPAPATAAAGATSESNGPCLTTGPSDSNIAQVTPGHSWMLRHEVAFTLAHAQCASASSLGVCCPCCT